MYLKSIEMQGFKSFANKMTLQFHDGITAIVGPNGSGKSNVGDAVRWVLGEQSAKQLRGGNMQDVIFSGTETRKPLGFASVAITLDNSDHKLNVDYEEVTVTRRLYRSGESEYLMNGSACRLKDINELFYDTGIGKEGYSIIGQGQIDKILSGKPEERRELFDEAAGIVKFKRRKAVTEKKLAEEQQNLVRVNDILQELTRQLGPLEKQSETAKIYLKKKEELKILDVNMFLMEMERIRLEMTKVEERFSAANEELEETKSAFEHTKQEYERLEQEQESLDQTILAARDQAGENALRRQQLENQIQVLQEQIHALRMNDEHYRNRMEVLQQELEEKTSSSQGYQTEQEELREKLKETSREQEVTEELLKSQQRELQELMNLEDESKSEIIGLLNRRASTKGKIQRYDAMLEQIGIRKSELSQKLLHLKTSETEQSGQMRDLQKENDRIEASVKELKASYDKADLEIGKISGVLSGQMRQMEAGQSAYHREASRLESLKNITERYDGYGNSIRKVMELRDRNPGIHGVVADLIQAEKRFETAIETALGGSIQNIVTDNETTAKYLIEYLKKGHYGRATFLPLTSMRGKKASVNEEAKREQGVLGIASALVDYEPLYEGLVNHLLGKTLVVDTIDHAIVIQRKYRQSLRMVTLEGELLSPGGSMTGGSFRNNSNLLGRRREIEELESSVRNLKKEMDQMQIQMDENRKKRNELRDLRTELNEKLQKQYLDQNTTRLNMEKVREKTLEIRSDYTSIQKEGLEIEQQINEIKQSRKEIEQEVLESQNREEKLQELIEKTEEQIDQRRLLEARTQKTVEEIRLRFANLSQKNGFLKENRKRLAEEMEKLSAEKKEMEEKAIAERLEAVEKENRILELKTAIEAADAAREEENSRIEEYNRQKEILNSSHKEFFEKRDELSAHISLMDKECFRLNSQKEKLEETRESQTAYLWEEYEITPGHASEYRMEEIPDRNAIRRQIAEVKEAIRKLGSVNVNAIEEYKEVSERHAFLGAQHLDLVKAAETLQGIIDELDAGMRRQFTEKFSEIRAEFDRVFRQLFGGGKGTLELEEDADVLEAGIRIISQPPGKKLQNMMQLSGGEKALTAIALLFAIQNLKPSPFCLLDEIEAALDDSNVTRFAQYLHRLTKNTQFIVITHRRGTMTAADRLYGITMQEKGISTLVSVDLIEGELDK
ncbi:MAG: chromosome segregation protein SMC [Fusicatenibacter sp.]|nr:chromosome segregation protein SMC [Fusicatenibacter sp.]